MPSALKRPLRVVSPPPFAIFSQELGSDSEVHRKNPTLYEVDEAKPDPETLTRVCPEKSLSLCCDTLILGSGAASAFPGILPARRSNAPIAAIPIIFRLMV